MDKDSKQLTLLQHAVKGVDGAAPTSAAVVAPCMALQANMAAGALGPTANVVKQLFHKSSASVPQTILPGVGWEQLDAKMEIMRIWYGSLNGARDALVARLEGVRASVRNPAAQSSLDKRIAELKKADILQYEGCRIHMNYQNKQGVLTAFYGIMCPSTTTNGTPAFLMGWGEISATGTKATEYMLVSHTRENFWSSKTKYDLVPMPSNNKGISESDTASLLGILGPLADVRFQDIAKQ